MSPTRIWLSNSATTAAPAAFGSATAWGRVQRGDAGSFVKASDASWISRSTCGTGPVAAGKEGSCAKPRVVATISAMIAIGRIAGMGIGNAGVVPAGQRCQVSRNVAVRLNTGASTEESTRSATK